MQHSDQVNELAKALASVQGKIKGAERGSVNPHFKSKYADLAEVWKACRAELSEAGIAVVQSPEMELAEGAPRVTVTTMLIHSSGQWVKGSLAVFVRDQSPHAVGSATTYARRYALAAMVGIAPEDEDDDGNAAAPPPNRPYSPPTPAPRPSMSDAEVSALAGLGVALSTAKTVAEVDAVVTANRSAFSNVSFECKTKARSMIEAAKANASE